jgi:uroporphyrinogen decarboxylase
MNLLSRQPSPDYRRLLAALWRRGLPDRVPFVELFADQEIIDECNRRMDYVPEGKTGPERAVRAQINFYYHMGYEYVPFDNIDGLEFPLGHLEAADTAEQLSRGKRQWTSEHSGPITGWADFERYPWPVPGRLDTRRLELAARLLPEGMCLTAACHSIFEYVTWLMGYETLCYKLYDEPDLVDAMFERVGQLHLAAAEVLVQIDRLEILFGGDDMGFKTGTMIGPDDLKTKSLVWHKKIAAVAHAHGKPYVLHSCGKLDAIMDFLIDEVRVDARHSFEDAHSPVAGEKRKYGHRLALCGGIDVDLLCRSTPEQVRDYTRRVLKACMPGGGYCLGTGNTVANYVPVDNYLAMLEEGIASGVY